MSSEITDDLLTLQKNLKVGDLSSRHLAEEMRQKYESKIDQFSSCDVELLNALAEDQLSSALISSEEKGLKALQTTGDGNCLYNSASVLIEGDQSANLILRLLTQWNCILTLTIMQSTQNSPMVEAPGFPIQLFLHCC